MKGNNDPPFDVGDPEVQCNCRVVARLLLDAAGEEETRRTILSDKIRHTGFGGRMMAGASKGNAARTIGWQPAFFRRCDDMRLSPAVPRHWQPAVTSHTIDVHWASAVCCPRRRVIARQVRRNPSCLPMRAKTWSAKEKIEQIRRNLSSLSWFMARWKEPMARLCNAESDNSGHFWEARFKCRELLDDEAVLTCSIYVDLNTVAWSEYLRVAKAMASRVTTGQPTRIGKDGDQEGGEVDSQLRDTLERWGMNPTAWLARLDQLDRSLDQVVPTRPHCARDERLMPSPQPLSDERRARIPLHPLEQVVPLPVRTARTT